MPKKKKGGKKKKSKKVKLIGNETPDQVMCRLLKSYEKNCVQCQSLPDPSLKKALQDGKEKAALLTKFVLNPEIPPTPEDPVTTLEPLVMSLRQERYAYIKDLHIWDMPLNHVELASLALLLEKGFYPLRMIELMDCLIEAYPLRRLSLSFNLCSSLSHISFDYNEFGDAGSQGLSEGLEGNKTIISVSLNYCSLGMESGKTLGHIVSTTAVRELYVDGNDLQCEGLIELVKLCADHAEEESYQREQERARKEEQEAEAERRAGLPNIKLRTTHRMVTDTFNSIVKLGAGLKKQKKGKKKKKK